MGAKISNGPGGKDNRVTKASFAGNVGWIVRKATGRAIGFHDPGKPSVYAPVELYAPDAAGGAYAFIKLHGERNETVGLLDNVQETFRGDLSVAFSGLYVVPADKRTMLGLPEETLTFDVRIAAGPSVRSGLYALDFVDINGTVVPRKVRGFDVAAFVPVSGRFSYTDTTTHQVLNPMGGVVRTYEVPNIDPRAPTVVGPKFHIEKYIPKDTEVWLHAATTSTLTFAISVPSLGGAVDYLDIPWATYGLDGNAVTGTQFMWTTIGEQGASNYVSRGGLYAFGYSEWATSIALNTDSRYELSPQSVVLGVYGFAYGGLSVWHSTATVTDAVAWFNSVANNQYKTYASILSGWNLTVPNGVNVSGVADPAGLFFMAKNTIWNGSGSSGLSNTIEAWLKWYLLYNADGWATATEMRTADAPRSDDAREAITTPVIGWSVDVPCTAPFRFSAVLVPLQTYVVQKKDTVEHRDGTVTIQIAIPAMGINQEVAAKCKTEAAPEGPQYLAGGTGALHFRNQNDYGPLRVMTTSPIGTWTATQDPAHPDDHTKVKIVVEVWADKRPHANLFIWSKPQWYSLVNTGAFVLYEAATLREFAPVLATTQIVSSTASTTYQSTNYRPNDSNWPFAPNTEANHKAAGVRIRSAACTVYSATYQNKQTALKPTLASYQQIQQDGSQVTQYYAYAPAAPDDKQEFTLSENVRSWVVQRDAQGVPSFVETPTKVEASRVSETLTGRSASYPLDTYRDRTYRSTRSARMRRAFHVFGGPLTLSDIQVSITTEARYVYPAYGADGTTWITDRYDAAFGVTVNAQMFPMHDSYPVPGTNLAVAWVMESTDDTPTVEYRARGGVMSSDEFLVGGVQTQPAVYLQGTYENPTTTGKVTAVAVVVNPLGGRQESASHGNKSIPLVHKRTVAPTRMLGLYDAHLIPDPATRPTPPNYYTTHGALTVAIFATSRSRLCLGGTVHNPPIPLTPGLPVYADYGSLVSSIPARPAKLSADHSLTRTDVGGHNLTYTFDASGYDASNLAGAYCQRWGCAPLHGYISDTLGVYGTDDTHAGYAEDPYLGANTGEANSRLTSLRCAVVVATAKNRVGAYVVLRLKPEHSVLQQASALVAGEEAEYLYSGLDIKADADNPFYGWLGDHSSYDGGTEVTAFRLALPEDALEGTPEFPWHTVNLPQFIDDVGTVEVDESGGYTIAPITSGTSIVLDVQVGGTVLEATIPVTLPETNTISRLRSSLSSRVASCTSQIATIQFVLSTAPTPTVSSYAAYYPDRPINTLPDYTQALSVVTALRTKLQALQTKVEAYASEPTEAHKTAIAPVRKSLVEFVDPALGEAIVIVRNNNLVPTEGPRSPLTLYIPGPGLYYLAPVGGAPTDIFE